MNIAPGSGHDVVFTVYHTPVGGTITATPFTATITGTNKSSTFYNGSLSVNTGDFIHLRMSYTGGNGNGAHDITAQIDLF